jgi:hypothetical protein
MFRSTLIAAGAVLLCSAAYSQQRIPPSKVYPITSPIQDAGTLNWQTKTWTAAGASTHLNAGKVVIYDNTCTWTGGAFYAGLDSCEDNYDEGRIPSSATGPRGTKGATTDNLLSLFQFGYCTTALTGTVDIKIAFYDNLGGRCVGFIQPTSGNGNGQWAPGSGQAGNAPNAVDAPDCYFDFGAVAGNPLPGSSNGSIACWLVGVSITNTPCCLKSDGDGDWDNNPDADLFNWSFQQENGPWNPVTPNGQIISGDPSLSPVGGCTYRIPCGTDLGGFPCGHGLDTWDGSWLNLDGVAVGQTNSANCPNDVGPFGGTNCYFFGGWPANPFASYFMHMESDGECAGCDGDVFNYCTPKTNSLGCLPLILSSGVPSAGRNTAAFTLFTDQALAAKSGILFYGISGPNAAPFQGGYLCVLPPTKRTPLQVSTGAGAPPCTGVFSFDFNVLIQGGTNAELNYGRNVWAQYWTRDSGSPSGTSLTNGISFTICL